MSVYYIDEGPLLPSLEHLIEYYCIFPDGLETTLKDAVSPAGHVVSLAAIPEGVHEKYPPDLPGRDRPPVATEPMHLRPDSIERTYELGQGEYGSVFKGTWKAPSGELVAVAVKTLNKQHLVSGKEGFLREAKVMVQLDHPCIVKLIGICEGAELMLVQELMPLGSLLDFLLDYPENVNVNIDLPLWSQQIAYGMKYLEKQSLVHRDLAARNILLQSKSQVKICDFGLSRATGANSDYYRASQGGKWPVKWYAPESINYGTFSSASDVWGYGVTLWEMYSFGDQPYADMTGAQVLQYVERKGRLSQPQDCPDNVFALMRRCWEYKSADRPSFKQIYQILQLGTNYENVSTIRSQTQLT